MRTLNNEAMKTREGDQMSRFSLTKEGGREGERNVSRGKRIQGRGGRIRGERERRKKGLKGKQGREND